MTMQPIPSEPLAAAYVLAERIGAVSGQLSTLGGTLERNLDRLHDALQASIAADNARMDELEDRLVEVERRIDGARWFLVGLAAGGGLLGSTAGTVALRLLGV